jgi:hypothetical protein
MVFVVDALGIFAGEYERHPPVAADVDRPSALPSAPQFMEAQTPGKFMSCGFVAALRAPRIRRNRPSCLA